MAMRLKSLTLQLAVTARLHLVLMATATPLMGLSPLIFPPATDTELYRGLSAIALFEAAFTALVTLTPPCFRSLGST